MPNSKLTFSGHETFHCRHFWLKKGYDFVKEQHKFSDADAVVVLGVGKNMVSAIRYWMRVFGILDEADQLTKFAQYIFGEQGKDPYLENIGTLWLLHYFLITTNKASIYGLVFNEFRKEKIEFTRDHLEKFLERKRSEVALKVSDATVKKDIGVFLKNYVRPAKKTHTIEDDFSAILIDLDLLQEMNPLEAGGYSWYRIESAERKELPKEILFFSILDQHENSTSISFQKLLNDQNNPGSIFAMNANGLIEKIQEIEQEFPDVVFADDAGIRELQFKSSPLNRNYKWEILDQYYAS